MVKMWEPHVSVEARLGPSRQSQDTVSNWATWTAMFGGDMSADTFSADDRSRQ